MSAKIDLIAHEGVDRSLASQVRTWANQVFERTGTLCITPYVCITLWKTMEEFQAFCRKEEAELGVVAAEGTDFLATHDAWRGYPRIYLCEERVEGIPYAVLQGVMHHELSHALHHGSPEYYTFRFSERLQEAGRTFGLDLPLLQHCVYFISVAIKDREAIQWLAKIGFSVSQLALLAHSMSDTDEDRHAWAMVQGSPPLRKIAFAGLLKILLPLAAMISLGIEEAQRLRSTWNDAYAWISEKERDALLRFAQNLPLYESYTFQNRLEHSTLRLLEEPSL